MPSPAASPSASAAGRTQAGAGSGTTPAVVLDTTADTAGYEDDFETTGFGATGFEATGAVSPTRSTSQQDTSLAASQQGAPTSPGAAATAVAQLAADMWPAQSPAKAGGGASSPAGRGGSTAPASPEAHSAGSPAGRGGAAAPVSPGAQGRLEDITQIHSEDEDGAPPSPHQGSDKSGTPKGRSTAGLGSYNDLKKRTSFSNMTTDGVKKEPTYMIHVSNYRTGPKYSLGARTPTASCRSSSTPAPGSYNMPAEDKAKFTSQPRFSFGGCARFGLGQSPTKKMPGPGAYNPKDPTLHMEVKVGFGSSSRSKVGSAQANPGPGAYEARSSLGQGQMFTAGGRRPTNITRSRSQPGPGAYNPMTGQIYNAPPKCGFGTSTRTDHAAQSRNSCMPGPGTYEMQSFRSTGSDAPKYSATSRRRVHDLNSYVTPGPGSYNAHVTSFGY